jgi:nitronate monooxygenase
MVAGPININFFCHSQARPDSQGERAWLDRLEPYYRELGLNPVWPAPRTDIPPFGDAMCRVIETARPDVVSFHFGLPDPSLLARVKAAGCHVMSSATTVEEARWLQVRGADAIIAQGAEAGGHRGSFLPVSLDAGLASQPGTLALVPQIVDAVDIPVIAAGGIADGRAIHSAFALGAAGVQIGTAYLLCPEAATQPLYRRALQGSGAAVTVLTSVFTGRPARVLANRVSREIGPNSSAMLDFPLPMAALAPLRAKAEEQGSSDFAPLWAGQAASLCREMPAETLTRRLVAEALQQIRRFAG